MVIFPFSNPILLWGVDTGALLDNTVSLEVWTKNGIKEISSIVGSEDLNVGVKLIFNHGMKVFEYLRGFRFILHEEYPT